jgi:hypothetical protein
MRRAGRAFSPAAAEEWCVGLAEEWCVGLAAEPWVGPWSRPHPTADRSRRLEGPLAADSLPTRCRYLFRARNSRTSWSRKRRSPRLQTR